VRSARIAAHDDDVNAVCFLDNTSQTLCSGSDDTLVKIWDRRALNDGPVGIFGGHVEGITFIDSKMDGYYIISNGKDQAIKLWDLRRMDNKMPKKPRRPANQWYDYVSIVKQSNSALLLLLLFFGNNCWLEINRSIFSSATIYAKTFPKTSRRYVSHGISVRIRSLNTIIY